MKQIPLRLTTGEAMRKARRDAGMLQKDLARRARVGPNTLARYERDFCSPTLYNVISLADVLGISLDEYVGRRVKDKKEDAK